MSSLPSFNYEGINYTVDQRLQQFRSMVMGKMPEFVSFDSEKGKKMMTAYSMSGVTEKYMTKVPPLSELKYFKDAFIELEGAQRAAGGCRYWEMIDRLLFAESLAKDQYKVGDTAKGADYEEWQKELQIFLDRTRDLAKDILPASLTKCGCK